MSLLIFWFGIFLILKGAEGLVYFVWSSLNCFVKFGQVVGFSEIQKGLYQTVLRFKSLNNLEYFLVDSKISPAPAYVMGEFIPILVSTKDHKKVMISSNISLIKNLGYVLAGGFCLGLNFLFFSISFLALLVSLVIFYGVYLYFVRQNKIDFLKNYFKFVTPFDQTVAPQVLEIENSKLINWTENYIGLLAPDIKKPFNFHFLKKLFKPIYLMGSATFIFLSVSSYKNVSTHTHQAHKYAGRYDHSVLTDMGYGLKIKIPQIRFYDGNRQLFKFLDKNNPFDYGLKTGDEVTILVSSIDPQNTRRDLKDLNQWQSFFYGGLAFLFLLLSGQSRAHYKEKVKIPVIRIKKAG